MTWFRRSRHKANVDPTDADLLAAAAAGDGDAYAILFRRHVRAVTAYAARRCHNADEVADLVAETFLTALQAAHRYEPFLPTALPWLFGIERRVLFRQRRRTATRIKLTHKVAGSLPRYAASEADAIESAIDAHRLAPDIAVALDRLPDREREVLELVAYDGLTPKEAAFALGVTPNAVRLRLSRARRRMREMLEPAMSPEAGHVA